MEIILLRHGKPKIPSLRKISASEFLQWVQAYNLSSLCTSSIPTDAALSIANKCNAVVCSSLPRSISSAEALGVNNITLQSSQFDEAGIPVANWATLKMSPKFWAVAFRILWLLGYSTNSESLKESKLRASISAKLLIDLADRYGSVLFVGHGVYNRLLANELKSLGWAGPKNPGSKHWSFGVYGGKKKHKY